jgi:hypothetical protein
LEMRSHASFVSAADLFLPGRVTRGGGGRTAAPGRGR